MKRKQLYSIAINPHCSRVYPQASSYRESNHNPLDQIVQKLTAEGASVLGVDINAKENESTAASCPSGSCHAFAADITLESSWREILSTVLLKFSNRLDVVVNCAGVVHIAAPSHEVPEDQFDLMFKVNVKPLYLSTKVIVPWFKENKVAGSFVNLSSISEARPRPNLVWYAASKGAVTVVSVSSFLCAGVVIYERIPADGLRAFSDDKRSGCRVCRGSDQV